MKRSFDAELHRTLPESSTIREEIAVCVRGSVEGTTSPHMSDLKAAGHFGSIDAARIV